MSAEMVKVCITAYCKVEYSSEITIEKAEWDRINALGSWAQMKACNQLADDHMDGADQVSWSDFEDGEIELIEDEAQP